jgi:sugar/nucleoside kinase (ribokinase family)
VHLKDGVETVEYISVDSIDSSLVVDTNGAGDSFVGGFYASFMTGKSVIESIKAGNALAGKVIQKSGC